MRINEYTREIIKPRQTARLDDPNAVEIAGSGARAVADVTGTVGAQIQKAENAKNERQDVIERARAMSAYSTEMQNAYAQFEQEMDLTSPNSAKEFAQMAREKASEILSNHSGSEDSRARLESQLISMQDSFSSKMTESSYQAQKAFITDTVGGHISRISNEVYNNPNNIESAFAQLNGIMEEYGPALDDVGEIEQMDIAQSVILESALNSFIDVGRYEDAKNLIDENPAAIEYLQPSKQMSVLGRIQKGLAAQQQEIDSYTNKIRAIDAAATEAGVELSKAQLFTAATGIKETQSPEQKIQEFTKIAGMSEQEVTPAIVAKIGYGVDLPSSGDIDMNKERTPDGGYTPKGIGAVIKAPYENAAATKIQVEKVLLQADEFLNTDNKQAGLASMIAFQKLIDDGAAVREGDIKLSAQGNSAFDNLKLMYERIGEGAIATPKQIQEMKKSAQIFGQSVLEASKTYIDPYLMEAQEKGYRMLDIGMPQQAYDNIFGNIKTKEDTSKRNEEITQAAKQNNMTVNEYITATAKKHNMTADQVAKKLGYTGKLGE